MGKAIFASFFPHYLHDLASRLIYRRTSPFFFPAHVCHTRLAPPLCLSQKFCVQHPLDVDRFKLTGHQFQVVNKIVAWWVGIAFLCQLLCRSHMMAADSIHLVCRCLSTYLIEQQIPRRTIISGFVSFDRMADIFLWRCCSVSMSAI